MAQKHYMRGSALGSTVSNKGANHVGRGSNPTNHLLGRWLNGRKPSWPITPGSPEVVDSGSGTPHYCPDVPHAMSKSGLSESGQWTHLRVLFFSSKKKKKKHYMHPPQEALFLAFFLITIKTAWASAHNRSNRPKVTGFSFAMWIAFYFIFSYDSAQHLCFIFYFL